MSSGVNVPITFEIVKNGEVLRTETLTQNIIKIGKLSSSHLRIDDESVSRMHAVIEVVGPSEIYVIDLGSTKGTIVNGEKVAKTRIKTGDEILLGDTSLRIAVGEPVAAASAAAPVAAPPQARSTVMGIKVVGAAPPPPFAAAAIPPPTAAQAPRAAAPAPRQPVQRGPVEFPKELVEQVEVRDGSRAVEVVAMFEDAIVETRYLTQDKLDAGPKMVQPKTRLFVGIGAVALVISFVLFLVSYVQISKLKTAKEAWEKAHPSGTEPFPMPREGSAGDFVALVLLLGGAGLLYRGLYRRAGEAPSRDNVRDFVIGPADDAVVHVSGEVLGTERFPLVRAAGQTYELLFNAQMKGDVTVDNKKTSLGELGNQGLARAAMEVSGAMAYPIPQGCRAKVDLGDTTFLVNSVPPPRAYPVPFKPDWNNLAYTGGTAMVFAVLLGMLFSLPPDPKSLSLDAFMTDQRFAKFLVKPPEEKEEQIPEWLKKKQDDDGGKGKRHKEEEGKMGKKDSKNKQNLYALKGPKDNQDLKMAKMLAEEAAKNAGVLGIMKQMEGSHLASIFGRDSALGADAQDVLGGLVGTQIGEAYGVGGLGLVGSGRGGGGMGEGTIGLGNLGTIGKGGGGLGGAGYGRGAGGLGTRRAHAPDVVPGTAQVRGALDKEIIRRIIRRHINEVKFCYEKELAKKPDLYGRIMIQFTIAGTGGVVAAVVQQSTMNNPPVEQCIAGAVRRWEFPKPQGGGVVIVSYPFVLKAAGGEE